MSAKTIDTVSTQGSKDKIYNLIALYLMLFLFLLVFVINHYAPLFADDYLYSFQYNAGFAFQDPNQLNYEKISSIGDYFQSLKTLYQNLTGRIVAHGMLQLVLLFPQFVFDALNTIIPFLFIFLMVKWVVWKDKKNLLQYMLIGFSLFYISLTGTETNLYLSAFSCNYIWTQVIVLSFLLPIRAYLDDKEFYAHSIPMAVIMLLAGLVTGDTNEPIVPGLIIALFVLGVYRFFINKKVPLWYVASFIGLLVGFAFLYFAPGNTQRVIYEAEKNNTVPAMGIYFGNLKKIIYLSIKATPSFILSFIAIINIKFKKIQLDKCLPLIVIVLIVLGTMFALLFIPILPKRLNIIFVSFYTIIALHLLHQSSLNKTSILLLIFLCLSPILTYKLYRDYDFLTKAAIEYKLVEKQIDETTSDSLLVTPRGYLDPLTRSNWAKPTATFYGKRYLWVYDVLDSAYFNNSKTVSFKSLSIIDKTSDANPQDVKKPIMKHYDFNEFSRVYYIEIPVNTKQYNPDSLSLSIFYANTSNVALTYLYSKLPRFISNLLMIEPRDSRDFSYIITEKGILFAFATANEGSHLDKLRLRLTYQDKLIKDFVLNDVTFH